MKENNEKKGFYVITSPKDFIDRIAIALGHIRSTSHKLDLKEVIYEKVLGLKYVQEVISFDELKQCNDVSKENSLKVKELQEKYQKPCHGHGDCEFEVMSASIEMAEWKDEQTKQLIIEFSKWLNERGFFKEDLQCDLEHQARTFLDKKGFTGAYE